jgi:hypothetical protein
MESKPTIEIEIRPDGQAVVHVQGVKGNQCIELTKFLEEGLGEVVSREETAEYFEQDTGDAKVDHRVEGQAGQ